MMLGNLLGHIDALLSDSLEESFSQVKLNAAEPMEGREIQALNDKRKVTFAESVMEKTISARTSTTVSAVGNHSSLTIDFSNEVYKHIDSYMCDLDNDLSITNYPSYLGESIDFIDAKDLEAKDVAETEYDTLQQDTNNTQKEEVIDGSQDGTSLLELNDFIDQNSKLEAGDDRLSNSVENDPFREDNRSIDHGFIINSPFSKPSADLISPKRSEKTRQSIFEESHFSAQELKSSIIDDFKNLKAEMDITLSDSQNLPVLDLLNQDFYSAGLFFCNDDKDDISEIFSQISKEDCISGKVGNDLGEIKIDIPSTPRSIPPLDQFMSPGQFFSQKSGKMGQLGHKVGVERPLWYTPKTDAAGCLLEPIDATPTDSNKLLQTPKGSRLVRPPLYSSPSSRIYQESIDTIEKNAAGIVDGASKSSKLEIITEDNLRNLENQDNDKFIVQNLSVSSTESNRMEIVFPAVEYRHESRISISINNPTVKDAFWTVKSVGNPYVDIKSQSKHSLDDIIFRFIQSKGKVLAGSDIILSISFFPLIAGIHTQTYHLRVQNHLIVLELTGESLNSHSEARNYSRPRCSLPYNEYSQQTPNQAKSEPRLVQTEPQKRILSLKKTSPQTLNFGDVRLRTNPALNIYVCNNRMIPAKFKLYISGPFTIPAEELCIDSKSYIDLPIAFTPIQAGSFKGFLVIKGDVGQSEKIILTGKCKK